MLQFFTINLWFDENFPLAPQGTDYKLYQMNPVLSSNFTAKQTDGPSARRSACILHKTRNLINGNPLQILRHKDISLKILLSFPLIELFPMGKIDILSVIEQQIFHLQLLRQLAGILYRGVVLFVRMKAIRLTGQTKASWSSHVLFWA